MRQESKRADENTARIVISLLVSYLFLLIFTLNHDKHYKLSQPYLQAALKELLSNFEK